ncbi:HEAT repeat domain-containing protein [Phormidium tenue]|uniref:HEAT repeat domain-containing protein n=1 Tax=Phormidium tenue TaxID=126344 RepID=UPI000A8CAFD4|nr:HEAT repeat domain-containing protein [Phormidium tenue]MBD2232063.1 HEAT repeat domain-containing protein [Phormidium tenue FACHB-1052]
MSSFDPFAVSSSSLEAVRTAVARLGAGDFHDRWEQSRQVADLGDAALDDLLAMLQDSECDWEARWFAARALGEFDRPEVIAALVNTFATTTDEDLRQAMAAALTQIGPGAIAALGEQLAQPALRPVAVQALARIHHPATIPWLKLAMTDGRSPVRATALDALSAFADPTLLPVVQQSLGDSAAAVRAAAVRGLLGLRLCLPTQQLIDALTPLLRDTDERVAQQAAYALGRLSSAAAATPLLQLLQTPGTPEALQVFTVQALSWQNTPTALDGLIQAWDQLEPPAQLAVVQGMAAVAPAHRSQATSALANWLQQTTAENSTLRRHLVLALGQMGDPRLERELRSLLHDPDPGVQLHAEAALRQLQTQSV